ncbi:19283_t:CDS:2, partial [Gigaspora margarita]
DIKNLQKNLNIDDKKFELVRDSNLLRPELCFSVLNQKYINSGWIDQIMNLVNNIEETNVIKRWNKKQIHIMIATSAFGLGIDMPDVRLVINYNFPMSMTRRDQKPGAKCVILYTRKDICTNYAIIADDRMSDEDNEQTASQKLYLSKAQFQLFEVMYYCLTFYECRFQQISKYYQLPNDPIPPDCGLCDNCLNHANDCASLKDAKIDILDMLNVISLLCDNNSKIIPSDVVDIFCLAKNAHLQTLADLVRRGLVKQTILLSKKANTAHLTCTLVIEGTTENRRHETTQSDEIHTHNNTGSDKRNPHSQEHLNSDVKNYDTESDEFAQSSITRRNKTTPKPVIPATI